MRKCWIFPCLCIYIFLLFPLSYCPVLVLLIKIDQHPIYSLRLTTDDTLSWSPDSLTGPVCLPAPALVTAHHCAVSHPGLVPGSSRSWQLYFISDPDIECYSWCHPKQNQQQNVMCVSTLFFRMAGIACCIWDSAECRVSQVCCS